MSLSAIASQLYTIQTKKNVPLKTAFSMMVREDLAMRFSVYNLARIVTKSEFIATVAQSAFGQRTPLQRKQDEQEQKREIAEKRFKQFTATSIAGLNRKISLLASITERNTALITGIYSELGSFRTQRRMNINSFTSRSVRVPLPSKTIKGQLDRINEEIQLLKKKEKRGGVRGVTAKPKKPKSEKENQTDFFSVFLPFILKNPKLVALLAGGASRAIGLGTLAAQAYSLYNLPGAIGRIGTRMGGKGAYEDPITEQVSQFADTGIATLGTYTAVRALTGATSMIKNRGMSKLKPVTAKEARIGLQNKMMKGFMQRGMDSRQAFGKASKRTSQYIRYANQLKKMKIVDSALRGIGKRLPAIAAATVAFELSRMSNYTADRSMGLMNQYEFKDKMVNSYANLIGNVGTPMIGSVLGGLAGTALFPGVGTSAGLVFGTFGGLLASLLMDERDIAEAVFEMIHEDRPQKPKRQTMDIKDETSNNTPSGDDVRKDGSVPAGTPTPTGPKSGPLSVRNNNPGNLRFYARLNKPGYVLENAIPGPEESYAVFPTPELGLDAMKRQIILDSQVRKQTLSEVIHKYAPKKDNNNPKKYTDFISKETGIKPNELIPSDRVRQVMYYMINMEGGDSALGYYKPYLRMPSAVGSPIRTAEAVSPPPTAAVTPPPNPIAERPPDKEALVASNDLQSQQEAIVDDAQTKAVASLVAVAGIKSQLSTFAEEASNRIMAIEKLNLTERAGYTHNDSTLNYRMNS